MQHDNSDDPFGFWKDEPTRELRRTHVGARAHTDTESLPVTRMVPVLRTDRGRPLGVLHRPRNPVVVRVGLMVGVMLLFVPVALSLRNQTSPRRAAVIQDSEMRLVGTMPAPAPTQATIAPDTVAPTTVLITVAVAPTEAVVVTVAPTEAQTIPATEAPTTVAKMKAAPKTTTSQAAVAPTAAQSADQACAATYTIASGDSWSGIASRAKVAMKSLLAVNNANVKTMLLPGKNICLPSGAVDPGPPATRPPAITQPPATTQPAPPATQPTTPPATSVPATTQPPPPANTYTQAQVAQIIRDVWPDDLQDEAIRIATRESGLIPTVRNACCYGLFQIYYSAHRSWLASVGVTSAAQLYDPRVNATAALALYNASGWAPWALTPTTTTAAA